MASILVRDSLPSLTSSFKSSPASIGGQVEAQRRAHRSVLGSQRFGCYLFGPNAAASSSGGVHL